MALEHATHASQGAGLVAKPCARLRRPVSIAGKIRSDARAPLTGAALRGRSAGHPRRGQEVQDMTTSESGGAPKPAPRPGPPAPRSETRRRTPRRWSCRPRPIRTASAASTTTARSGWSRSAGERVIGSWQAGEHEAAYAHFGRRFDDLHTEVALMERRLGVGHRRRPQDQVPRPPRSPRRLPTASVLGDVDALAARLTAIVEQADAARRRGAPEARRAPRRARPPARRRWPSRPRTSRPNSTQWKAAGDRLREILDEWRTDHGARPQDRRRAVEAVLRGPRDVQPPPRLALRRTRPRAGGHPPGQGGAVRARRAAGRLRPTGPPPRRRSATC